MGRPKQLLPFGGQTLLGRAVATALASTCRPIVVTTGAHRDVVEAELRRLPVVIAHNADWAQGMSSSLRVGLTALLAATEDLEGAVVSLVDQPLVGPSDIDRLVATYRQTGKHIVASEYDGTRGVPMFIGVSLFAEARTLQGKGGAKELMARYPERVALVPLAAAACDVDTPADYDRLAHLPNVRSAAVGGDQQGRR